MATFEVYLNGKVVQKFEAERVISRNDEFVFNDRNSAAVGRIVKVPGMSVKRVAGGVS